MVAPYITTWSAEESLPTTVIQRRDLGIAFADEILGDRDEHGVLWHRAPSRPGRGRPQFGKIHPGRQRRAMRALLCQVCANPADQTEFGTLWLVRDFRDWQTGRSAWQPPSRPSAFPARTPQSGSAPPLRKGYAAIRVRHSTVVGIYGARYRPGPLLPTPTEDAILRYTNPAIPWICASQLVRELRDCTLVEL
jgi:hypothetical protein